ncbi:hypothetical protein DRO61_10295 [Candidatus Bathyarchaeota archaeon]|nr:MAG: hypothetical protein DRO61_10295 [Candidatus Bathyarchaeota archaeon]
MVRFDIVVCDHCKMDTCEVNEEDGDIEASCGMCGFYEDAYMENIPTDDEIGNAIVLVSLFKDWAERRNIEEPSAYAIMKSREDGISMWMNLESLGSSYNCAKYNSGWNKLEELEKESIKIFNFLYSEGCPRGSLMITEKVEVGKENVDLVEYIIG